MPRPRHAIANHARHLHMGIELLKPLDHGRNRSRCGRSIDHKNNRRVKDPCHIRRASSPVIRTAAIEKAHDSFDHRNVRTV